MDLLLQHLASQYHQSDYNRAKYGHNGSPVLYTPLSLYLPERFNQLRAQQLQLADNQPWWPANHTQTSLQDDILDAMTSPLHLPPKQHTNLKTSSTHPINISSIIPPDLVDLVSSHAHLSSAASATLLDVHSSYTLHRLINFADPRSQANYLTPPVPLPSRRDLTDAMCAAISTGIRLPTLSSTANGGNICIHKQQPHKQHIISALVPAPSFSVAFALTATITTASLSVPSSLPPLPKTLPSIGDLLTANQDKVDVDDGTSIQQITPNLNSVVIGNLYLSSCPGKKVRLHGPVHGRTGVCRDVETDMIRMKQLGVSCIVCCLDDEELALLGAPWAEYERCAASIGIDVLRLPTPEGLSPVSPSHLDGHLVELLQQYSLKGKNVLVHCRGGVGRAGVIACCWLIRSGLCGWPWSSTPGVGNSDMQETLEYVKKVINVVRKRRSMKAVETYEQVKFLVEYVNYLRTISAGSSSLDGDNGI